MGVVGDSRLEKGCECEDGRSIRNRPVPTTRKRPRSRRMEVRALIGAEKQGNACGAKEGRKTDGEPT